MNLLKLTPYRRLLEKSSKGVIISGDNGVAVLPKGIPFFDLIVWLDAEMEHGIYSVADIVKCMRAGVEEAEIEKGKFDNIVRQEGVEPHAFGTLGDLLHGVYLSTLCSKGVNRPAMHYVHFDHTHAAATDGWSLDFRAHSLWFENEEAIDIHKDVFAYLAVLGKAEEAIEIGSNKTYLVVKIGGVSVQIRKSDERYPNTRSVIPRELGENGFLLNRKGLLHTLETITKKAEDYGVYMVYDLVGGLVLNFFKREEHGKEPILKRKVLITRQQGDVSDMLDVCVAVDPALLSKMLKGSTAENVLLGWVSERKPIGVDSGVLMPLFLSLHDAETKDKVREGWFCPEAWRKQ